MRRGADRAVSLLASWEHSVQETLRFVVLPIGADTEEQSLLYLFEQTCSGVVRKWTKIFLHCERCRVSLLFIIINFLFNAIKISNFVLKAYSLVLDLQLEGLCRS